MKKKTLLNVVLGITLTLPCLFFAEEAKSTEQSKASVEWKDQADGKRTYTIKGKTPEIVGAAFLKQAKEKWKRMDAFMSKVGVPSDSIQVGEEGYTRSTDGKSCKLRYAQWFESGMSRDDVHFFCIEMCQHDGVWILESAVNLFGNKKDCFVSPICRKK